MVKEFKDEYDFLSNFYIHNVVYEELVFPTNENAFQAMKTSDKDKRQKFTTITASQSKQMGRQVQLRSDWEEAKNTIMYEIVKAKFSQDNFLKEKLLATKNEVLEEGNWWHDNYWGICNCIKCQDIKGKNNLGKILMLVRKELQ